ncbi:MAG: hypothetical protein QOI41_675 [Myxococcales bacterium]|nr:hypothetical protein [Myxococcales bacterium]
MRATRVLAALAFMVALGAGSTALAQGTMIPEAQQPQPATPATAQPATAQPATTAEPATTAQPQVSTEAAPAATQTQTQAPVFVAPPAPAVPAQGQWVYTDTYGWIWVPEGATTVAVQEQPYVYLYTPAYGWTWYGSPWGHGRYYVGPWVHHAWGPPRVWHRGGLYAPAPHAFVHSRIAAPRVYRGGGGHRGGHR